MAAAAELGILCGILRPPSLKPPSPTTREQQPFSHASFITTQPSISDEATLCRRSTRPRGLLFRVSANLGGGGGGEEELKKGGKKKFITKEEEPEQYWQTAGERKGENPMKTPLPYIIIFGMSTPFVILAIAFANGWVKVPVR